MNREIKYAISFHSLWHCGSGETKGADIDSLVIKDKHNLPYIPGKTLKGIIKDAYFDLKEAGIKIDDEQIVRIFGRKPEEESNSINSSGIPAQAFFTNATLNSELQQRIIAENLFEELYQKISSTSIDEETGTAKEKSLRSAEMTIPLTLYGSIKGLKDDDIDFTEELFSMVKRMGTGRNRGFGRCTLKALKGEYK